MAWSRERIAVAAYFAVLGVICATWASSIDDMKLLLGLNQAQQGWLLLSGPVGNLVSDDAIAKKVDDTVNSLNELLKDLKAHPKRYVHFSLFGKKDKADKK